MMGSDVSVLIAARNAERWIEGAIKSSLDQTLPPEEVLVVDDASTDLTARIVEVWESRDPRVRLHRQPEHLAQAAARNAGLCALRTTWVALLDADDECLPTRLERQMDFARRFPCAGAIGSIAQYMTARGEDTDYYTEVLPLRTPEQVKDYLNTGRPIAINHPSALLHRERVLSIGGYRDEFSEDLDLWNRLVEAGHPVLQQHEVLVRYRVHNASMMAAHAKDRWKRSAWTMACMRARRSGEKEPTYEEFYRERTRTMAHYLSFERWLQGQTSWRAAATAWVNGDVVRSFTQGAVALLVAPEISLKRLWTKLRRRPARDHGDESWDARTVIPEPYDWADDGGAVAAHKKYQGG